MRIRWTAWARSDLERLREFLAPADPRAAVNVVQTLISAPDRLLLDHPRLGVRLSDQPKRDVRRLFLDDYEMRYELRNDTIIVLRVWHTKEDR
jgi:plasmid stabilization system protein ParE